MRCPPRVGLHCYYVAVARARSSLGRPFGKPSPRVCRLAAHGMTYAGRAVRPSTIRPIYAHIYNYGRTERKGVGGELKYVIKSVILVG